MIAEHRGSEERFRARAVIDASGTWARPGPLGAGGVPATGERAQALVVERDVDFATGFGVERIERHDDRLSGVAEDGRRLVVDAIVATTGFRPDLELVRELRLELDPSPRRLCVSRRSSTRTTTPAARCRRTARRSSRTPRRATSRWG